MPSTVGDTMDIINDEEKHNKSCPCGAYSLSVFGDTPQEKRKVRGLRCKRTSHFGP